MNKIKKLKNKFKNMFKIPKKEKPIDWLELMDKNNEGQLKLIIKDFKSTKSLNTKIIILKDGSILKIEKIH